MFLLVERIFRLRSLALTALKMTKKQILSSINLVKYLTVAMDGHGRAFRHGCLRVRGNIVLFETNAQQPVLKLSIQ